MSESPPQPKWPLPVRLAAGLLTIVAFCYLVWALRRHWGEVAAIDWRFSPGWLIISLLLLTIDLLIASLAWRETLIECGLELPRRRALRLWALSALARYLPGRLWSLLTQLYLGRADRLDLSLVWRSNVRLAIYATGAQLLVAALLLLPLAPAGVPYLRPLLVLAGVAGGLLLLGTPWERFAHRTGLSWCTRRGVSRRGRITLLLAVQWGVAFMAIAVALRGAAPGGVDATGLAGWTVALAVTGGFAAAQTVAAAAVLIPGGLGVREGALAAVLGLWLEPALALSYSIGSRLWLVAGEIFTALLVSVAAGHPRLPTEIAGDAIWEERARLGGLRAVIDPGDRLGGRNLMIHDLHRRALEPLFSSATAGRTLDVGAGNGRIISLWNDAGARNLVGVDRSLTLLRQVDRGAARLVCADITALPFRDHAFDTISCVYVLGHVEAVRGSAGARFVAGELARVTAVEGRFIGIEKTTSGGEAPISPATWAAGGWCDESRRRLRGGRSWRDRLALLIGRHRGARALLARLEERHARRHAAGADRPGGSATTTSTYEDLLTVYRRGREHR